MDSAHNSGDHKPIRILVVGGGMVGAQFALASSLAGHSVTLIERDGTLRGASQLNLGVIRVSGRAPGPELQMARYGRMRWEAVARRVPEVGFVPSGSIALLRTNHEIDLAEQYLKMSAGAVNAELVFGSRIQRFEPAIETSVPAALICHDDGWIRPGAAVPAMLEYLEEAEGMDLRRGVELRGIDVKRGGLVASTTGGLIHADHIVVAIGPAVVRRLWDISTQETVSRRRMHGFDFGPIGRRLKMIVTDASAFGQYPGYPKTVDSHEPAQFAPPGTDWVAVNANGRNLLVGIVRTENESIDPKAIRWLAERTSEVFGTPNRSFVRRWSAAVMVSSEEPYIQREVLPGVTVVNGLGSMGNTLSPAIARDVIADVAWRGALA